MSKETNLSMLQDEVRFVGNCPVYTKHNEDVKNVRLVRCLMIGGGGAVQRPLQELSYTHTHTHTHTHFFFICCLLK